MNNQELPLRDRILEISRKMLFSDGYRSLSMRKVAKSVGVSATSIYLHFQNKDHLLHTLIEESLEDLSSAIEEKSQKAAGALEQFELLMRGYVDFAMNHPEKYQIIFMVQPGEMAPYPKEKFRKARKIYEHLTQSIEQGIREGVMEVEHPVMASYSVWAQLHGVISVILTERLDKRIDLKLFIEESIDHIMQGFLSRSTVSQ